MRIGQTSANVDRLALVETKEERTLRMEKGAYEKMYRALASGKYTEGEAVGNKDWVTFARKRAEEVEAHPQFVRLWSAFMQSANEVVASVPTPEEFSALDKQ